jgi:predicted AlkP superfamily pyrophosphatase or phosphodiesterase
MSFDTANSRKTTGSEPSQVLASFVGLDTAYFLAQTRDRVKARLLHLLFSERIENVYEVVTAREGPYKRDITLLRELFSFLQETGDTPFLAQVHLMGTHGAQYRPRNRVFSHGKEQTEPYMVDFYDDSILDFDRYAQDVIAALRDQDKLDDTLIVIYSDHGQVYKTDERIPLIIRLPREERRGRVSVNVQAIDIAPTILDYMRVRIPDWMEGRSLFASALSPLEPMISTGPAGSAVYSEEGLLKIDTTRAGPPFYSLGSLRFTICHQSFSLDLKRNVLGMSRIPGHTSPCDEDSIPAVGEMETRMLSHLRSNGYEISPERPPATVQVLD